jgi:hypothetical protein
LYGCEPWSLIAREEHRLRVFESRVLRVFENRVLRGIFGPKRKLKKILQNEEVQNLHSSTFSVRSKDEMVGARSKREMRNAFNILGGRPEGKRPLGRYLCGWGIECQGVDWIQLAQDRVQCR